MSLLRQPAPPSLPSAGGNYERAYHDQFNNVLRLYFNQLSNNLTAVFGDNGGQYIECPNGLFFNTADQTFAATNTAYPIVFNATYLNNAVALQTGSTSKVEVSIGGVYNFQYSGQVKTTNSSDKNLYLWITRNGTDIGYSTHAWTFHDNNHYAEISWNFNIDLAVGEYIELKVAADSTAIILDAETATSPHPGIPSSVLSVNFMAPLPNIRPTLP
ncbi:MAG: hypothetical protein EBQ85_11535 [Proteobacteria bacterium]|nr:hypothetical protein [Pseudomonadota bacterium]